MITETAITLIMNQLEFHLIHNQEENITNDHMLLNWKGTWNLFLSVYAINGGTSWPSSNKCNGTSIVLLKKMSKKNVVAADVQHKYYIGCELPNITTHWIFDLNPVTYEPKKKSDCNCTSTIDPPPKRIVFGVKSTGKALLQSKSGPIQRETEVDIPAWRTKFQPK